MEGAAFTGLSRAFSPRHGATSRRPSSCIGAAWPRRRWATNGGRWPSRSKGWPAHTRPSGDGGDAARLLGVAAELRGERIVSPPWLQAEAHPSGDVRPGPFSATAATSRSTRSGREQADTILARLVADAQLVVG